MTIRRGYVDTPQGQVHYAEAGEGPAVVLIHHTPRSWTYYRPLMPLLAGSHRVVALDTLGFGASDPAPEALDIGLWADNVAAAMDGLGIERADVVGAMTGARIAMELAFLHPDRVKKVVYIAFPFFVSEEQKADRIATALRNSMGVPEADGTHVPKVWRWVMSNLAAVDDATTHAPGVHVDDSDTGAEGLELDEDGLQYLADWVVDSTRAGSMWRRTASIVYTTDPTTRLPAIDAPTLLIATTGKGFPDYLQVEGQEAALALVPDGRMAVIDSPRSDSRLMQYHADEVAAILRPFLSVDPERRSHGGAASDENAIRNCLAHYFHHLDDRDFEEWTKLLTDDVRITVNGKAQWPPDLQHLDQRGQHVLANTVVDIAGEEATVLSDYFYVGEIGPERFERIEILDFGRYTDRLVKCDGRWLISEVAMQVIYGDRGD